MPVPLVSSINYAQGQTVANAIVAPLGTNGGITLYSKVQTHVVIDVNGYYDTGAAGPQGPSALLRDANGTVVGLVQQLSPSPSPSVDLLRLDGDQVIRLRLTSTSQSGWTLSGDTGTGPRYVSTDCTGTGYLYCSDCHGDAFVGGLGSPTPILAGFMRQGRAPRFWKQAGPDVPGATVGFVHSRVEDDGSGTCIPWDEAVTAPVIPVEPIVIPAFSGPFRIELAGLPKQ